MVDRVIPPCPHCSAPCTPAHLRESTACADAVRLLCSALSRSRIHAPYRGTGVLAAHPASLGEHVRRAVVRDAAGTWRRRLVWGIVGDTGLARVNGSDQPVVREGKEWRVQAEK